MRNSLRAGDDADLIRARLRHLLDEANRSRGWVPEPDDVEPLPADGRLSPHVGAPVGPEEPEEPVVPTDGDGLPLGLGRHRAPGPAVRLAPGRPAVWSLWVAGLLAALLVTVWTWWERPRVEPAVPSPAPATASSGPVPDPGDQPPSAPATPSVGVAAETSTAVVVSVVGLVVRPGVVTLPEGARVADAVSAAGGMLPDADPASVNLAAKVADGQQIAVGVPGAALPSGGAVSADPGPGGGPVDLNTASAAQLDALPGIGPVLAQRIVDHRTRSGPFASVEQLDDVPGIGPATFAELADLVGV